MSARWQQTTLGEVVSFKGGGTPSTEKASYWNGDITWVSPKDMKSSEVGDSIDKITPEAIENSAASLIPKDAVLIVVRSGILARTIPVAITARPLAVNQDIKALCPSKDIDPYYLHYFMQASEANILTLVTRGATVHRLSTDSLKALKFPKPPLPEQQRIVAVLDEAFAGLATAIANAEKNLNNARDLFESYLRSLFAHKSAEWQTRTIGNIAEVFDGPHATPKTVEAGPVFLGISALKDGVVDLSETRHVTADDFKKWTRRVKPRSGDVVFSYETRLGQAAIIPEGLECCLGRRMGLVRCDRSKMEPRFFLYQYLAKPFQDFLGSQTVRGATVDRISVKEFPSFEVKIAPLAEQQQIIAALDSFAQNRTALEEGYQRKLVALANLKQSILQKAFSGDLTAPPSQAIQEAAE